MADPYEGTIQSTISRLAPYHEDYARRLMESTFAKADVPDMPPSIQVAGLEPEIGQARQLIQGGIGGYAPYAALGTLGYAGAQQDLASALARQQEGLPYMTAAGTELAGAQTGLAGALAPLTAAQTGITGAAAPTAAAATPYITGAAAPIAAAQAGITGAAAPTIAGALAPIQAAQTLAQQAGVAPTQAGIAQYMSPYQADVTQSALAEMQRQADMARNRMAAEAVGAGAYGGARMGVQGAELERGLADVQSQRIFQDLQTNYNQALGAFQRQQQAGLGAAAGLGQLGQAEAGVGRQLGDIYGQLGALGTQQAGLGATLGQLGATQSGIYGQLGQMSGEQARQAGLRGDIAGRQAGLGTQLGAFGGQEALMAGQRADIAGRQAAQGSELQKLYQQDIAPLFAVGDIYQTQQERELEAQRQNVMNIQREPYSRLSFISDILRGVPSAQSTVGIAATPQQSPLMQGLGLGIGALGTYQALK